MELNLHNLKGLHPLLPATTATELGTRGAVALERRGHQPGCSLTVSFGDGELEDRPSLFWNPVAAGDPLQLDAHRTTEDGAEAVALAMASVNKGWAVRRRLQRGAFADWLLVDDQGSLVALEVSGIDGPPDKGRLTQKLDQVCKARDVLIRSACVVAFEPPSAALVSLDE